ASTLGGVCNDEIALNELGTPYFPMTSPTLIPLLLTVERAGQSVSLLVDLSVQSSYGGSLATPTPMWDGNGLLYF
ncbi:MAG: hypothetical protein ACRC1H_02140, partial [Caldilineaceae bacterium]